MRPTLISKNIKEENESTWEDRARVMGKFISTDLDMNYSDEEINMFISRVHRDSQVSAKSHHKGPRPLFVQFTNWQFADEVCSRIITLTSRRVLNVYANYKCFPKSSQKDVTKH